MATRQVRCDCSEVDTTFRWAAVTTSAIHTSPPVVHERRFANVWPWSALAHPTTSAQTRTWPTRCRKEWSQGMRYSLPLCGKVNELYSFCLVLKTDASQGRENTGSKADNGCCLRFELKVQCSESEA